MLFVPRDGRVHYDICEFYYYTFFDNAKALHMKLWVVASSSGTAWQKICHAVLGSCTSRWEMTKLRHFCKRDQFWTFFSHSYIYLKLSKTDRTTDICTYVKLLDFVPNSFQFLIYQCQNISVASVQIPEPSRLPMSNFWPLWFLVVQNLPFLHCFLKDNFSLGCTENREKKKIH